MYLMWCSFKVSALFVTMYLMLLLHKRTLKNLIRWKAAAELKRCSSLCKTKLTIKLIFHFLDQECNPLVAMVCSVQHIYVAFEYFHLLYLIGVVMTSLFSVADNSLRGKIFRLYRSMRVSMHAC